MRLPVVLIAMVAVLLAAAAAGAASQSSSPLTLRRPTNVAVGPLLPAWSDVGRNSASGVSSKSSARERTHALAIRLLPAPIALRRGCASAARRLEVVIYCPTRVPAKWSPPYICAGCHSLRLFTATGWFPAPRAYVGQPGEPTGHLNVWAASSRMVRLGYVGCPGRTASGLLRIAGLRATWIVCPEGSTFDSGHVVLQWSRNGWTYGLSLHSNTATNRRLLRMIAGYLARIRA